MLGSRIKRGGQDVLVAAAASVSRKPLWFLYPQWIRKSSVSAPSQRNEVSLPEFDRNDGATLNDRNEDQEDLERLGKVSETYNVKDSAIDNPVLEPAAESKARSQQFIRRVRGNINRLKYNGLSDSRVRQEYYDQRRLERGTWVPDWRVILSDMLKHTPDAGKWLDKTVKISIPVGPEAEKLVTGIDDNIWDIGKKYGCSIIIGPRSNMEGHHIFLLSGPSTAVGKTASDVLNITSNKAVVSLTDKEVSTVNASLSKTEHSDVRPLIRTVVSEHRARRSVLPRKASMLPKPETWTTANFAAYVHNLTNAVFPNHMHRSVYKKGEEGRIDVIDTLRDAFADSEAQSSISRKAFNEAMTYLVKLNRIADARALFVRMDIAKLQMDPETFNIMLRGAAKQEDLHNFHYVLHLMFRWGFTPNPHTWIAFLMAVKDVRIKAHIISAMKRKGLVNHTSVLKSIGEQLVGEEITFSLERRQSLDDFLQRMDQKYGHLWLTTSAGNRVLHVLGSHGLISQCWVFLQEMEKRFVKIDTVSINTCLSHCTAFGNLNGVIDIIKRLWNFQPDDLTFNLLFKLAVTDKVKNFNLARVVWKYACLSARTTAKMRAFVLQSLKGAGVNPSKGNQGILGGSLDRLIGLIIVGLPSFRRLPGENAEAASDILLPLRGLDKEPRSGTVPLPSSSILTTSTTDNEAFYFQRILSGEQLTKSERREWYDIVRSMLQRDCSAFKEWRPAKNFGELLVEALEREEEWKRESENDTVSLSPDGFRRILDNSVLVPIKRIGSRNQEIEKWV
ncbi:hypothetical protein F5884DRAFT_827407 [Xylogone sp. PMI_703]|nr:hypothetical protein F5884DRAFT_827407 [Xylogone sp. PMI_703]